MLRITPGLLSTHVLSALRWRDLALEETRLHPELETSAQPTMLSTIALALALKAHRRAE